MKIKTLLITILPVFGFHLSAQDTIIMPLTGNGGFYNTCYAVVYDNGLDSNYQNFSNSTVTISPLWVQNVSLYFEEFNTEIFFDTLTIYDGPGSAFPKIGTYSGNSLQGQTITSSGSSITLEFRSDDIQTGTGFKAWVSCLMSNEDAFTSNLSIYPNPATNYLFIDGSDWGLVQSMYLIDITGKIIKEISALNSIDVRNLSPGIYGLIICQINGFRYYKKWVKE